MAGRGDDERDATFAERFGDTAALDRYVLPPPTIRPISVPTWGDMRAAQPAESPLSRLPAAPRGAPEGPPWWTGPVPVPQASVSSVWPPAGRIRQDIPLEALGSRYRGNIGLDVNFSGRRPTGARAVGTLPFSY